MDCPIEYPGCNFCAPSYIPTVILKNAQESGFDLVECGHCQLRYISPRPTWAYVKENLWSPINKKALKAEAENYYNEGQLVGKAKDPAAQKEWLRKFYLEKYTAAVKIFGKNPKSIFEVGGSVGWFSFVCKTQGVPLLDGCEISTEAVEIAHENFGLAGHDVGNFNEYVPHKRNEFYGYNWVAMFDYIEHTWDPKKSLRNALEMTSPGGLLLLKTFLEDLDTEKTMLAPPWHAYHFFGDVLYKMLRTIGYQVRLWEVEGCQVFLIAQKA